MSISPTPTPGALLRARRQELGLTLDEVADRTRIRRTYLEALEEDRTDALPGETYRAGFLRIYASHLGLKPEKVLEGEAPPRPPVIQQEIRGKRARRPSNRSHRSSQRSSKRSGKGIYAVAAAALLILGAVFSASLLRSPDPVPPPPAPVATAPSPPEAAPAPTPAEIPAAGAAGENAAGESPADAAGISGPVSSPSSESVTTPPEAGPEPKATEKTLPPEPAKPQTPPEAAAATAVEPAAPSKINVLRLQALGTNHVELILDNRPPQSYDLKADTQLSWKVRRSALIRVDDPSTVKLWFGDRPVDLNGKTQILVQTGPDSGQGNQ